jgi:hypothetical protein
VDSSTTSTILRELKYFQTLKKNKTDVTTIVGCDAIIVCSGRATIVLPTGTQIVIEDALLYLDSTRTLLSYKDIHRNGFHVETNSDNKDGYLFTTKHDGYSKRPLENIPSLSSGLYDTYIKPVQHVAYKVIFQNLDVFKIWHDRLGHPGIGMMRKIIGNSIDHKLNTSKFPKP